MPISFEQAEQEYYSPPDDLEYDYCECCESVKCKIFNGQHICEDCGQNLEEEKWLLQFEEI